MNQEDSTIQPRFVGKRFEDHTLPLEVVKDLFAYEDLLVALAKDIYIKENADRKRVPRGFSKGFSINIKDVEKGSTKPLMVMLLAGAPLFNNISNGTYFEKAHHKVMEALKANERGDSITDYLEPQFIKHFNRIGKSIKENEFIEFEPDSTTEKAKLDKNLRLKMLKQDPKFEKYSDSFSIYAYVSAMDKGRKTFGLETIEGESVTGISYNDSGLKELITTAFSGYDDRSKKVLVTGTADFDKDDRITGITEVDELDLLDTFDVGARIEEIKLLNDGWYDGEEGLAPSNEGLNWLAEKLFEVLPMEELQSPAIFPTIEGNIDLDWVKGNHDLSIEIDLKTKKGALSYLDLDSEIEKDRELDFNQEKEWHNIVEFLKEKFPQDE